MYLILGTIDYDPHVLSTEEIYLISKAWNIFFPHWRLHSFLKYKHSWKRSPFTFLLVIYTQVQYAWSASYHKGKREHSWEVFSQTWGDSAAFLVEWKLTSNPLLHFLQCWCFHWSQSSILCSRPIHRPCIYGVEEGGGRTEGRLWEASWGFTDGLLFPFPSIWEMALVVVSLGKDVKDLRGIPDIVCGWTRTLSTY